MRKKMSIALGVGALMWTASAVCAQNVLGGLGDAAKKGASDAAKQKADDTVGVPGAADKAANPKGAAKDAANGAQRDANDRATGATHDAVNGAMGGTK